KPVGSSETTSVMIVGVGGQGILLASEVLSEVALLGGLDVKKSEVHGMSQRGGAVTSHVRFGPRVFSPVIPAGRAGFLVALEKLEALRWAHYLAPDGALVINDFRLDPAPVSSGKAAYPEHEIHSLVQQSRSGRVVIVDGQEKALQAGDVRTMNTVVLGALSRLLQFPEELWLSALKKHVKERFFEINRLAFDLGRQTADHAAIKVPGK
ncbi:MAG: indolepyruvate oxidoreductase subunit beta, partial [Gemmatimonadota bacterium]|nr:indolepyruvate oxidoreductase subunit beta [Gemmatimonadota bacterium]